MLSSNRLIHINKGNNKKENIHIFKTGSTLFFKNCTLVYSARISGLLSVVISSPRG